MKKLGYGRYGEVYLVERISDGCKFAMKLVTLDESSDMADPALNWEAEVLLKLNHPYIVKYYESFVDDQRFCILMEYAEQGDLKSYIQQAFSDDAPLDESLIWKWAYQISLALSHISAQKIIHRDIKPQNIFLTAQKNVKLGDFGIARVLQHSGELARTNVGTPYYLAPEICKGSGYDSGADIWGLGCVLYELCCFRKPFEGDSLVSVVNSIVNQDPEPIPVSYSENLREFVMSLLSKNPATRPSICLILKRIKKSISEEERMEICRPHELDLSRKTLKNSYQKDISINIPTPTSLPAQKDTKHPNSAPSKPCMPNPLDMVRTRRNSIVYYSPSKGDGLATQKASNRHFSFSESVLKMCPVSPNRPMLMGDFLRKKLGTDAFERVKRVLCNTKDPAKLLKEEPWIISDICGEENLSIVDVGIAFGAFNAEGQVPYPPTSTHRRTKSRAFPTVARKIYNIV